MYQNAYEALVLSLLFYGSEAWVLLAAMRDKILTLHQFVCGVTLDSMIPGPSVGSALRCWVKEGWDRLFIFLCDMLQE
jgi:hypothetical protein